MEFHKYHGLGNDFILINAWGKEEEFFSNLKPNAIEYLCRRKYGVGADGVLVLTSSANADFGMRLFNADGGEAELSGNGLRCLALFIKELGLSGKKDLTIETIGGKTKLELLENNRVRVWMPKPIFERKLIPMIGEGECVEEELDFSGGKFNVTALSLGNPHCVLFGDFNLSQVLKWGTIIESSKYFPRHTNVEFAYLLHEDRIRLMVFERGVGLTDACGSGACAVTIAGIKTGRLRFDTPITIMQKGGDLLVKVTLDFKDVILEGEARKVFEGKVDV